MVFLLFAAMLLPLGAASSAIPSEAAEAVSQLEPVDVALDPGHSTWDVGATGGGLREHELTLDVAQRARAQLELDGFSVRLTREDDRRVAPSVPADPIEATRVEQFARHAAAGPARVFVSIHFNGHPDRTLRGTETYFNADNFGAEGRLLATLVHTATLGALAEVGYASPDRGVREDLTDGKPYGHFAHLLRAIEHMIHTLKPAYPVECTLLTTGMLDALMHSNAQGHSLKKTEHLAISYKPVDWPFATGRAPKPREVP